MLKSVELEVERSPTFPLKAALLFEIVQARLAYKFGRDPLVAFDRFRAALDRSIGGGFQADRAAAMMGVGRLLDLTGCFEQARPILRTALSLYQPLGHAKGTSNVYDLLGRIEMRTGNPPAAIILLEQAEQHLSPEAKVDCMLVKYYRAIAYAVAGALDESDRLAKGASDAFRDGTIAERCARRFASKFHALQLVMTWFLDPDRAADWRKRLEDFLPQTSAGEGIARRLGIASFARLLTAPEGNSPVPSVNPQRWLLENLQAL